jgi:hypothetical protein
VVTPDLTRDHFALLFPDNMEWSLETRARHIFEATLSEERSGSSIVELLGDLVRVSASSGMSQRASIVWLVRHWPKTADEDGDEDSSSAIIFAFDPTCVMEHALQVKNIFKGSKVLHYDDVLPFDVDDSCAVSMEVFVVENPSSKQIMQMNKLHGDLPASVSMHVPAVGKATVVASNFAPKRSSLYRLFFGEYTAYDEMMEHDYNATSSKEKKKNERFISEQITAFNQVLTFPQTVPNAAAVSFACAAAFQANKTKTDASEQPAGATLLQKVAPKKRRADFDLPRTVAVVPLLNDLPLGIRLINSYRNGFRDR